MKPQNKKEGWKREFDKEFPAKFWNFSAGANLLVKSFISSLLHDREEEMVRAIGGLKEIEPEIVGEGMVANNLRTKAIYIQGRNDVLDEVINKIIKRK